MEASFIVILYLMNIKIKLAPKVWGTLGGWK